MADRINGNNISRSYAICIQNMKIAGILLRVINDQKCQMHYFTPN